MVIVVYTAREGVCCHCPQGWPRIQCRVTLAHVVSLVVLVRLIRLHCQAILGIVEGCVGLSLLLSVLGVFLVSAQSLGLPSLLFQ